MSIDQGTIADGIGNMTLCGQINGEYALINTRAGLIQGSTYGRDSDTPLNAGVGRGLVGIAGAQPSGVFPTSPVFQWTNGTTQSTIAGVVVTRRYQVQLALGLMTQEKLIPTKYMASQLAIELTLETPSNCIIASVAGAATVGGGIAGYLPGFESVITYAVSNVNLIPEILEFDASYDTAFLQGLQNGGVPLKFSSWHTFLFSSATAASVNLLIQERSRSVKSIFTVQRKSQPDMKVDNGATFFDTSRPPDASTEFSTLQNYQYRVGGRYS